MCTFYALMNKYASANQPLICVNMQSKILSNNTTWYETPTRTLQLVHTTGIKYANECEFIYNLIQY